MGAILSPVFVVDVEATCWETKEEQGLRPNEIIEIGICKLDLKTGVVSDVSSYVVRPRFTKVSPFCTQLTGWTQQDVDGGADILPTIMAIDADYGLEPGNVWFSCGEYDRVKLSSAGRGSLGDLYGDDLRREFNIFAQMKHVNIKTLFALKKRLSKEVGMERMLGMIGEKLEGRHHNGADDAANIAKIVKYVLG